jgi:regulator of replication initiation timing
MWRMGSVAILMAIMAMPVQAQRQGRTRGPAGPEEFGIRERGGDDSADAIIRLRERLGLSEEQVERLKEAQAVDREARDAMRLETREMRDRLRDGEITREEFREEFEGRRSRARDDLISQRETLNGILNDEQRSQMRSFRREANRRQGVRGDRAGPRSRDRGQVSRQSRTQRGGFGPRLRR